MRLPEVSLPALPMPRLGLAAFRRRLVLRAVFALLALAPVLLALLLLSDEKQRMHERYEQGFKAKLGELTARLHQSAGQLALLNASYEPAQASHAAPLLLPFGALDFDDRHKAAQAVELSGCAMRYADGSTLCSAVGANPWAGGFVYLVAQFDAGSLRGRSRGQLDLSGVHRLRLRLAYRGEASHWLAALEGLGEEGAAARRGTLAGFQLSQVPEADALDALARPDRDFRGWMWQDGQCLSAEAAAACLRRTQLSVRVPVAAFQALLRDAQARTRLAWPPPDLGSIRIELQVMGDATEPLFSTRRTLAEGPFLLGSLATQLAAGETLRIASGEGAAQRTLFTRAGAPLPAEGAAAPWLLHLVRWLPVDDLQGRARTPPPISVGAAVSTLNGRYRVELQGSAATQDLGLAHTASRLSGFVLAMSGAVVLAWLIVELGLIRRIALLTRRAAAVSFNMQGPQLDQRLGELDVSELRGRDELGILAGGLADLLHKVREGVRREHIRAEQEREQWHAVGHEIMSPLQSLLVLHAAEQDPSRRYVLRMQQAVKVLYGTASPSEAIAGAAVAEGRLDVDAFLRHVAANAGFAGIAAVRYERAEQPLWVIADEYALEDALTHVLNNAARFREPGSAITLSLIETGMPDATATVLVCNRGPQIAPSMLERIFEYGVSGDAPAQANTDAGAVPSVAHRGQGLFVARTYLAKMGGTIEARNLGDGVAFALNLARA